ncbi:MAG: IS3 family transposase [Sphingobacteriales bacterium]|nr:MAG: IS3 family transposase [Sphingobacteriales bacterium]
MENQFSVLTLCRVLKCSSSAYYNWKSGKTQTREIRARRLVTLVRTTFHESGKTYGSPRIYRSLKAASIPCSRTHIVRIMQQQQIWAVQKRKYRITTESDHKLPVAENLLNRDFTATQPNQKWVTDITYVQTKDGWLYLAIVMDLFSRKIIGWAMKDEMKTELPMEALKMAIQQRKPGPGLIHHSDPGVQYASNWYQSVLAKAQILCSMSRKGDCWDNAVAESFFSTLKRELIYSTSILLSKEETRSKIFKYIETWYNRQRMHSLLQYLSPVQYEYEQEKLSLIKAA